MMPFINRYATPATLGLFAISAVSGVALFLHMGQGLFHSMHEWLSLLLLAPFAFHVWRNWGAMTGYIRRGTLAVPLAASLAAAAVFAVPALMQGERGSPFKAVQLMTQTPLKELAPVLKTSPDALQAALRSHGYTVASANDTLASVASSAGVPAMKLLMEAMPPR
jgi:hypothetical protein